MEIQVKDTVKSFKFGEIKLGELFSIDKRVFIKISNSVEYHNSILFSRSPDHLSKTSIENYLIIQTYDKVHRIKKLTVEIE